ncbi:MAG TPA: 16S rRNA (adenine(1518)-N(6)/adenine(1519)-N(6))-dimethyltransferase RsmA [Candidatus Eisenbacteria bacterium]|nr:16S rRNA (adenine(1518)-N(6)/adenine(1519)-N(6))-dimethyltransferase RsmA [Candidatus Eisenbacteria bacterium]
MSGLTAEAKAALQALGVAPTKRRGQNFMVRAADLEAIAETAGIGPGDDVVEIGPGLGFLTRSLLSRGARVAVVEKDFVMTRHLRAAFPGLRVLEKDILKADLSRDFGFEAPVTVVGNIPYNITSPILEWLIGQRRLLRAAYLTVQKEVGVRLAARPGGKEWGSLSAFVQYHAAVSVRRAIGRSSFYPPPKVDSALVELLFSGRPAVEVRNEPLFFSLIRRSFQKRRKTLLNALRSEGVPGALTRERLLAAFQGCGLDPRRRPETLSLQEWAALADRL